MPQKVVALVASYRKGHAIDTLTDAVLDGIRQRARQGGCPYSSVCHPKPSNTIDIEPHDDAPAAPIEHHAPHPPKISIEKIYLAERHIAYCTNCRSCTQQSGLQRGACVLDDDMAEILAACDAADTILLASPVNFYNTTAVFRTFLERLIGTAYWPWGANAPKPRSAKLEKKAVLIASAAAPGFVLPLMTGAPRALRLAAQCLGAKPAAKLWAGMVSHESQPKLSEKLLARARQIGSEL